MRRKPNFQSPDIKITLGQTHQYTMSDEQILAGMQNRQTQERAFRALMTKYQERLYLHIRRMKIEHADTDDILQNTLVKVYRNIHKFEGKSGLYTWLYRIATNEALTFLRQKKRRQSTSIDTESTAYQLKADVWFDGNEAQIKLKAAVDSLPKKQQRVFNMRYFEELPYKEISEAVGTSVGALKASYHHAVKKIEDFLKQD